MLVSPCTRLCTFVTTAEGVDILLVYSFKETDNIKKFIDEYNEELESDFNQSALFNSTSTSSSQSKPC